MGEYTEVAKEDKEAGREATKEAEAMDKDEEEEEEAPMSLVRKAAFISSILFALLLCAVFLWGLPCDLATCIQAPASTRYSNRTRNFLGYSNPTGNFLENDRVASSSYHLPW